MNTSVVLRKGIDRPSPILTGEHMPFNNEILKFQRLGSMKPLSIGNKLQCLLLGINDKTEAGISIKKMWPHFES